MDNQASKEGGCGCWWVTISSPTCRKRYTEKAWGIDKWMDDMPIKPRSLSHLEALPAVSSWGLYPHVLFCIDIVARG